jgi:eukaryotic-like serine/threonine-protein kinase
MRDTERDWPFPAESKAPSDGPRTQIGPYQLIAKIGEGGMGTVWLTKLPGPAGFNKLAVVKELRADLTGSAAFVEMFLNEARLAARLTHPNVIHTYGANEDRGRLYIAMEYLDGQPWSQVRHVLWANRSLPLALHLKVLADALTGLHYAHELRDYDGTALQVVHRDMSPQNVFVTYDGLVKVVDFGVARALPSSPRLTPPPPAGSLAPPPRKSEAPMFVGKVAYSGPEQLRGEAVDRRADVFAVGVMLWEALAGRRLMETEAGQDRLDAVRKRASEPAPRIRDVVSSMPRVLSDICDRALALDPNDRFSTALEFRDAIKSYLDETAPDLDSAQLGQLVSGAFRDERSRINGLIERSLMRSLPASPPPIESLIDTLRPPPESGDHTIRADLSELASVSKMQDEALLVEASNSAVSTRSPLEPTKGEDAKRKQLLMIAGGVIALLFVWVGYRVATHAPDDVTVQPLPDAQPADTAAAQPAPAPSLTAAAAPAEITLEISAVPANASIFLDGAQLKNPFSGKVKSDSELHILRVSAPGMQTQEKVVPLDGDKMLHVALLPAPTQPFQANVPAQPGRRPGAETRWRDREPPAARPSEAAPREGPPDFDTRITPEAKPREIYEEDPY